MACPPRAIWLVPVLVLILPFLLLNWRTSPPRIPVFELRDRHNESLSSQVHESQEGYQLSSYIRRGERVWNLGVDMGTSCILIAKLSGNLNGTVCIEPNTLVLPKARDT